MFVGKNPYNMTSWQKIELNLTDLIRFLPIHDDELPSFHVYSTAFVICVWLYCGLSLYPYTVCMLVLSSNTQSKQCFIINYFLVYLGYFIVVYKIKLCTSYTADFQLSVKFTNDLNILVELPNNKKYKGIIFTKMILYLSLNQHILSFILVYAIISQLKWYKWILCLIQSLRKIFL